MTYSFKVNHVKNQTLMTAAFLATTSLLTTVCHASDSESDDVRPRKVRNIAPPPSPASSMETDAEGASSDGDGPSKSQALVVSRRGAPYYFRAPDLSVKDIYTQLTSKIIGEDDNMRALATYYFRHRKSQALNSFLETVGQEPIKKVNVLMMGPTGSGKTASVKLLAQIVGVPFYEADTSCMTRSGYVGDSVDSAIEGLLRSVGNNVARAEQGIILFDEVDKIAARRTTDRDIGGRDLQAEFLKLVEGKKVTVKIPAPLAIMKPQEIEVDTSKILFIGAGAFSMLPKKEEPYTTDDIVEAGFMPEFVGRFGRLIQLGGVTEEKLYQILVGEKSKVIRDNFLLLRHVGINLVITDEAKRLLSKRAFKLGTGVRGLENYVVKITEPILSNHDILEGSEITVDKAYIESNFPEIAKKKVREDWESMFV